MFDHNPALAALTEQEYERLRHKFPTAFTNFDRTINVMADDEGHVGTFWVRDGRPHHADEPFGSEDAANEAKKARIMAALYDLERQGGTSGLQPIG